MDGETHQTTAMKSEQVKQDWRRDIWPPSPENRSILKYHAYGPEGNVGNAVRDETRTVMAAAAAATAAPLSAVPDGVRITTSVTDRSGKPVMGLTLKDFELRDDGVVQKLVAVEPRRAEPRRIAILLDEFHIQPADSARVREAVTRFVDERMRADDTAVVLKPLDSLPAIRLTADRARLRDAIAQFEGRKGNFEPRNTLEEETLGRAPALVAAGRAQVVLSALRALAGQLGSAPGRSAILLVSEGFAQPPRRLSARGLPDAGIVERFANRYDVPVYAFDPRPRSGRSLMPARCCSASWCRRPAARCRAERISPAISRAPAWRSTAATRSPTSRRTATTAGIIPCRCRWCAAKRMRAAGPVTCLPCRPKRAARCARRAAADRSLPTRLLRRSPLINVWFGVTRATETQGRVVVTWEPGRNFVGTGRSNAARATLKATTQGRQGPVRGDAVADACRRRPRTPPIAPSSTRPPAACSST